MYKSLNVLQSYYIYMCLRYYFPKEIILTNRSEIIGFCFRIPFFQNQFLIEIAKDFCRKCLFF